MPRRDAPKTQGWGDKQSSWDKQNEASAPIAKRYNRRCKVCGIYLTSPAEDKIGVHIHCVQAANIRAARLSPILTIRPRYGSNS
jgi:hypothetical protein